MDVKRTPRYQTIDGIKYSYGYTPEDVRAALNYMPKDGDVVLVSFLKVGNNWLEQIMQLILHKGEAAKSLLDYQKRCPYLEALGTKWVESMKPPRFFKTHFFYERQPMNPRAKYVYLTRNPLDVCVSFYHFTRTVPVYGFQDGSFDDFFDLFVTGQNDRGDFLDHVLSWYSHKDDHNVHILTYEQLKRDFRSTVIRLGYFLGDEFGKMLERDERIFNEVLSKSSIPYMSKLLVFTEDTLKDESGNPDSLMLQTNERFLAGSVAENTSQSHLVRKGIVGDWKNHFEQRHLDRMRTWIHEKKAEAAVKLLWDVNDLGGVV